MFSDMSAAHIVASHRREISTQQQGKTGNVPQEKTTIFSTGIRMVSCLNLNLEYYNMYRPLLLVDCEQGLSQEKT